MTDELQMSRHIIVNGLPNNVTPEKRVLFLRHMTKKVTEVLGHENFTIHLVLDETTGLVAGAFLSFGTVANAEDALARLNLYRFTKTDVLTTYRWSSLQAAGAPQDEYRPPELADDVDADFAHTMSEDAMARPQFFIKQGESFDVEWYWFNYMTLKDELYRKPRALKTDSLGQWTEMERRQKKLGAGLVHGPLTVVRPMPAWSTFGRMIISQHTGGLKVWGGRQMSMLFEVPELDINAFLVSPQEKYLVVKTLNDVSVWDIRTAKKIRTLGGLDLVDTEKWPITRFNAGDSLVAISHASLEPGAPGKLFIYRPETMRVLQASATTTPMSHTFTVPGLKTVEWNPVMEAQMAVVMELGANQGWKVTIQDIVVEDNLVHEEIIAQRNFLQAEKLDLLWHPQGTHLVVKITKTHSTEYALFAIGTRSAAVMQLQVEKGLSAGRFAWQPSGPHFAVIFEDTSKLGDIGSTSEMRIYNIKKHLKLLGRYVTNATHLFWAPRGARLVATNYAKSTLHFYGINDNGMVVQLEKHSAPVTDTAWDPTGRFYASWVSALKSAADNQFRIFDLNGRELLNKQVRQLSHFSWRPLAPPVLTAEEIKMVRENLSEYSQRYERELKEQEEREEAELRRVLQDKQSKYIKRMRDIARYHRDKGFENQRAELIASSPWSRLWARRMKSLPEEETIMHEDVTEERIVQRRTLN
ncbi:putative translation initiation factor [Trypanosoma rangeli]|uniref:Putative translation initiation factor n=1 Tax=Trypanosoma rangeli TaxID=5698 RepID=A0A3R7NH08_TRYRA|nr:putative translation initiation factor [Trypanosoma rangeli]RNF02564.1 putative translation initiation factor [Trypanosoma rangeli]|eukprot:RNF02564.1 putative translation initiation factor [Trypanosoma rangeli]